MMFSPGIEDCSDGVQGLRFSITESALDRFQQCCFGGFHSVVSLLSAVDELELGWLVSHLLQRQLMSSFDLLALQKGWAGKSCFPLISASWRWMWQANHNRLHKCTVHVSVLKGFAAYIEYYSTESGYPAVAFWDPGPVVSWLLEVKSRQADCV